MACNMKEEEEGPRKIKEKKEKSLIVVNKTMNLPLKEEGVRVCVGELIQRKDSFLFPFLSPLQMQMALAGLFFYFRFVQSSIVFLFFSNIRTIMGWAVFIQRRI